MTLTHGTIDTLTALQTQIGRGNEAKGFHDESKVMLGLIAATPNVPAHEGRTAANLRHYIMAKLGLIVTEAAEGIEEVRKGHAATETYYELELADGTIEKTALSREAMGRLAHNVNDGKPYKPEGLPSELADVVIRAFDLAYEFGIDLAASIDEKLTFNATRARLHGKKL